MTEQPTEPALGAQSPEDLTETTIPDSLTDGIPVPSQDPGFSDEGEVIDGDH